MRSPEDLTQTRSLIRAILQQELDSEYLVSLRTSHLLCEAEEEVPWTLDGEYGGSLRSVTIPKRKSPSTCPPSWVMDIR